MKKLFYIVLICLIAISSLVAGTVSGPSSSMGEALNGTAYVDINLAIDPAQMYFYTFGFSNASGLSELVQKGVENVPKAAGETLLLNFNPTDSTAFSKDPIYFWYKVRTNESFSFKVETTGALVDTKGKANPLDWTVTLDKVDIPGANSALPDSKSISSKDGNQSTLLLVEPVDNGETYSAFKIGITTDTIPFLSEKALFSGSLKMSIEAN